MRGLPSLTIVVAAATLLTASAGVGGRHAAYAAIAGGSSIAAHRADPTPGAQPTAGETTATPAAESKHDGGVSGWLILVAVIAIAVAATKGGRETARSVYAAIGLRLAGRDSPPAANRQAAAVSSAAGDRSSAGGPTLYGISGEFAGIELDLGEDPLIIGRDPRASQLVFVGSAPSVSGRHCSIRFDAARQAVVLEDLASTNGTFLRSGQRVPAGQPTLLRPADSFYLGDPGVLFEVRY